jgi:signal transduction histidine kinase/CheY-like chemotaxis protein
LIRTRGYAEDFDWWRLAPPVVAVLGLLASLYGWLGAEQYTLERNQQHFQTLVGDTQEALDTRFALYMQSLWGATGLLAASEDVDQDAWSTYVSTLDINQRLPGILGIDYVDYVLKDDMPAFLSQIPPEYADRFTDFPDTSYPDRFIIRYVGSVDDSGQVLGTDISFEQSRREAAERARDTGTPIMTDIIRRQIVRTQNEAAPSFLLLIPAYWGGDVPDDIESRRRNIRGWVDAPFVGASLLRDLSAISANQVAFSVYDGTELTAEQRIFSHDSVAAEPDSHAFSTQTTYDIAGQVWTINWYTTGQFDAPSNVYTPRYLLAFGVISTLLLSSLLHLLVRHNAIVNRRVKERTVALHEAKLQAEKADSMKSEFLANMSHELRTPLNGVIGTADLLMNTQLTERQYEYASIIARSGESLLLLINDVLDISKIEAGQLEINPERFVLRHMLKDAIQPQLSRASQHDTELNVDYDPKVPYGVVGDPLRISQVVINLVANAIKFADRGSVTVRVGYQPLSGDTVLLKFEIEDHGIGIAPDRLKDIFGKFSQADATITRKYGGTGLGLTISKNLVELMGGEIGVRSEVGAGSVFWFTVPVDIAQREPPEQQSLDMEAVATKQVLVIEPSAIAGGIISKYLTTFGTAHQVLTSIEEGGQAVRSGHYDACVISDVLGESAVHDFVRQARHDGLTDLRFVLITSVNSIPEMGAIESSGFSSFVLKPIYPDDLLEALMRTDGLESFRKQVRVRRRTAIDDTRVLLVEDDPINQKVAGRMLEELGYKLDIADNGLAALNMAERTPYDIALMDVMMPVMDGYTATRRLREMQQHGRIAHFPIIALTANAMKEQIDKCIEAGMDDFLTKPVRQRVLEEKLDEWLSTKTDEQPEDEQENTAPAAENHDAPTLNREQLEELKSVMGDEYTQFVADSLDNIASLINDLKTGVAETNCQHIYQTAHSLISNCAYIGASVASSLAREIESLAHPSSNPTPDRMSAIDPLLEKLTHEVEGVSVLLQNPEDTS